MVIARKIGDNNILVSFVICMKIYICVFLDHDTTDLRLISWWLLRTEVVFASKINKATEAHVLRNLKRGVILEGLILDYMVAPGTTNQGYQCQV